MRAYRIGRKPAGPWPNNTPPLRGGIYRRLETDEPLSGTDTEEDTTDDATSVSSNGTALTSSVPSPAECSSTCSVDENSRCGLHAGLRHRTPVHWKTDVEGPPSAEKILGRGVVSNEGVPFPLSPARYTDWAVQEEIDQDLQDYPSLDPAVQQDIIHRYRLLHQRVHDEGFYDCRYWEYGKEMIRYVGLFIASMAALRYGWYLTSAVCLGLFWVRPRRSALPEASADILHV